MVHECYRELKRFTELRVPARVRESDRPYLLADTTRLEELLGWRPQVELNDALARIWADPQVPTELASRYEVMRKP